MSEEIATIETPQERYNPGFKTEGFQGRIGKGRPKGTLNRTAQEVREFSQRFVQDEAYLANLKQRIFDGEAPHMETMLWHHAYGKPKDTIEIHTTPIEYENMPAEALAARAAEIAKLLLDKSQPIIDVQPVKTEAA